MSLSQIVFASGNAGKIRELNELLTPLQISVVAQADLGVEEVPETGLTFVENALIKARNASLISQLPALADDSGLEVDALLGEPGLYSARYAQINHAGSGDVDNYKLVLDKLRHVTDDKRSARFRCVMVYLRHANDPAPLIAQGTWEGVVLHQPVGTQGFGYDPVFGYEGIAGQSAAQLDKDQKNRLSHRSQALKNMLELLSTASPT
jgi:XTP/dITP diphosphohydrolase